MTFSIDNPEGGLQQPPLGKYVLEKPSGEQGLRSGMNYQMTSKTTHKNPILRKKQKLIF